MRLESNKLFNVPRRVTKPWQDVFHNLANVHKEGFSTNDLKIQMEKLRIELSNQSVQVKLARYVSKGFLKKLRRNRFQITPKGTIFFRILEENKLDR